MNPGRPPTSMQQQAASAAAPTVASEWRRDEHGRFMQALELYGSRRTGDEWKLITAFVGSRTIEEVRLHGRQYLQRLVQQLPPSPEAAAASRFLSSAGSQNDPNRQNYQVPRGVELQKPRGGKGKRPVPQPPPGGSSALSAAALECAQSMSVQAPVQFHSQPLQPLPLQYQPGAAAPRRSGRRSKPWTFQEDKAFETVLADWAGTKPYSWAKIAAALPGKTAKDVRNRYDDMVGEIASIESGEVVPVPGSSALSSVPSGPAADRPQGPTSTLSRRAVPPPPIEVPPRSVGKDGAVGVFPSGSSTRSRRGSASGIAMLSPTFLDLLANEAESEEKSPLPMSFPGLTNLPSPLFSPTLLPSGSPGFFSPGTKKSAARGQQDKKFSSSLDGSGDAKMEDIDAGPTASAGKSDDPRRSTTPRIWNDFLADDFKFDDPLGSTPRRSSRKTPRSKAGEGSPKTSKKSSGQEDVEMADASAA